MAVKTYDTTKLEQAHRALEAIAAHRRQRSAFPWDGMYYELMAKYFENILTARERGLKVATTSDVVPSEIFYASGVVPFHISMVSCGTAALLREQETCLSAAKSFGLTPEVCTVHRIAAAFFTQGWAPPVDAVVFNNESCDNNAKSSELITHLYQAPGYYFDCPYRFGEPAFQSLAGELEDLFQFLARLTGQPVDLERLKRVLALSRRMVGVGEEINRLRQAVPYPGNGRLGLQMHFTRWYWQGTEEGVRFFELVRDSLKARLDSGDLPPQRYRFVSLFVTPNHSWKLLDWMEREHGAYVVFDPHAHIWGPIAWDLDRPFHTLAQRVLADPVSYLLFSPIDKWVTAVLESVRKFSADGAIFWAHSGCRQSCATIRTVRDALSEVGVPILVLDVDMNDPSFVSDDELKERIEGFLERLQEMR